MQLKKYSLRVVALIMACLTGITAAATYTFVSERFQLPDIPKEICIPSEPVVAQVNSSELAEVKSAIDFLPDGVVTNDTEEPDAQFDHTGEYGFAYDIQPKGFSTFYSVTIVMSNYDLPADSPRYGEIIAPRGYVTAENREYKFRSIAIGVSDIAFQTEIKHGISYNFTGKFPPVAQYSCDLAKDNADLTGRLIKIKDGKVTATTAAKLVSYDT